VKSHESGAFSTRATKRSESERAASQTAERIGWQHVTFEAIMFSKILLPSAFENPDLGCRDSRVGKIGHPPRAGNPAVFPVAICTYLQNNQLTSFHP
jgi:hypothetical protein